MRTSLTSKLTLARVVSSLAVPFVVMLELEELYSFTGAFKLTARSFIYVKFLAS